ncbi:MAG: helix-turn-helix domain-containing protein [Blastocatellia bacterium]
MTLGDYVKRKMEEKKLSSLDVEKRSGGLISDSFVDQIRLGQSKRPSVKTLRGLAVGLGVDILEVLAAAEGREPPPGWTPHSLADAVQKIVASEGLTEVVQAAVGKDEETLKRVARRLRSK